MEQGSNEFRFVGLTLRKVKLVRLFVVGTILASCLGFAIAQSSQGRDGFAWNHASQSWKLGYVTGFVDAASWAGVNVDAAAHVFKSLSPKDRKMLAETKDVWDYGNIYDVQLVDGINNFYADNLNKAIKWDRAISYVRDCIHGESKDYLENELNFERRLATSGSTGK
jgi:hypothetical protein